jgi:predicted porin
VLLEGAMTPDVGGFQGWTRMAAVGVGSDKTGYIALGRQFTPIQAVSSSPNNDPFGGAWLGGIATVYSKTTGASNAITYQYGYTSEGLVRSAPRNGLGVVVMYALGEASAPDPSGSGDQVGFNVSYGTGPWWGGYAYHTIKGNSPSIGAGATTNTPVVKQHTLGFAYAFAIARLHLGINQGTNDAVGATKLDRKSWHVGITAPAGPQGTFRFLYGKANDGTPANRDFRAGRLHVRPEPTHCALRGRGPDRQRGEYGVRAVERTGNSDHGGDDPLVRRGHTTQFLIRERA